MTYMYDPQLDHFELWHQAQEQESKVSILGGPALPALGHAVSGATGAAISNVITYPLSLAITRLQVQRQFQNLEDSQGDDYKSIADAFQRIYAEEGGISAFYSGCVQDTAKSMADSFLFFLAYNIARKGRLSKYEGAKRLPVHEELAVGMVAGAFAKFFTTPVQQIVTRKQTAAMVAKRTGNSYQNLSAKDIALQIRDQKGIAGFWSGYSATLILTLNPALTFLFHETLLRMLVKLEKRENPGGRMTFLIAALSKAMASTITYPFSLAKSRAQVSSTAPVQDDSKLVSAKDSAGDVEKKAANKLRKDTIFDTLLQIARGEGLLGLYQGLGGEVVKGFFSHGLTMVMKERIHKLIIRLYYMVLHTMEKYPSADELSKLAGEKSSSMKDAVGGVASDAKEAVADAVGAGQNVLKSATSTSQDVLDKSIEVVNELYRKGKDETADILADYVETDDDDDNGGGW